MKQLKHILKNRPFYLIIFLFFLILIVTFLLINNKSLDRLEYEEGVEIPKSDYEDESTGEIEEIEREKKKS